MDVECVGLRGHYKLNLYYDEPYAAAVAASSGNGPTLYLEITYHVKARELLSRIMNDIVSSNPDCIVEHGAARIMESSHKNNE